MAAASAFDDDDDAEVMDGFSDEDEEDFAMMEGDDIDDADFFRGDSYSSNFTSMDRTGLIMKMKKNAFNRVQELLGELLCGDLILVCLREYGWKHEKLIEDVLVGSDAVMKKIGVTPAKKDATIDLLHMDDNVCFLCGQTSKQKRLPLFFREGSLNPLADNYKESEMKKLCPVCCMPLSGKKKIAKKEETFSCPVCWNDVDMSKTFALGCGHRYCEDCWHHYLEQRIVAPENLESVRSVCMCEGCTYPIPDCVFAAFIRETPLIKKYVDQGVRQIVACEPHCKWCPYPGCEGLIWSDLVVNVDPVKCSFCGNQYCFSCSDVDIGDHRPCPCDVAKKWIEKASDEAENITWMAANTKQCPRCHAHIEKNGGCMHMTCRKDAGGCGYEFCWLCRGPWSEHGSATGGYYACNKYEKSAAKKEDEKAEQTKKQLETYLFYYHRYDAHRMASRTAMKQKDTLLQRRCDLVDYYRIQLIDTAFLNDTLDALIQFHRALEFSYAYGYFIKRDSPQLALFQYSQENLEKYTNHLTEIFEMRVGAIKDFFKWKEDVINYTRMTTKFLVNFSRGVAREF